MLPEHLKLAIFRAEVVPPLADAVCFINGDKGDPGVAEEVKSGRLNEPFGGDVEKFEFAAANAGGDESFFGA